VNSLTLERAGIAEDTPDSQGGHRGRDASGRLNGKLEENAAFTMDNLLPSAFSREQAREGVKLITEMMARLSEPFVGSPDDYGIIVTEESELYE